MASFLEYAAKFAVKENVAVAAFSSALSKQKEAFQKNELNRRSWVKPDGSGFTVKLGKLATTYRFDDKPGTIEFLDLAANSLHDDQEFRAQVEKAYAAPANAPAKRGRKPKGGSIAGNG